MMAYANEAGKLFAYLKSELGWIVIRGDGNGIESVHFQTEKPELETRVTSSEDSIVQRCAKQIQEYLNGERITFDLALRPAGTAFQQSVWEQLLRIPCGETKSYGDIARSIGKPNGVRAVGGAIGRNPVSIIIPCHRVIGSDGSLTGYAGELWRKQWLLQHEKRSDTDVEISQKESFYA
ncbi:methylated-DNA--[protein]-cysteine S-methyltransferase [Paenibacillus alkalitolerans]|uniref:methylated-DNA--[protein]-cysteine S-methyltransferase n=1 Tax=Paenibacillus alkalitolerans TaxID=2799335 RepID=UPI001F413B06|nr:methylated-DNA--[protein]-cysteine S-methyltransferase [Paenibacillus alkalitolerans]